MLVFLNQNGHIHNMRKGGISKNVFFSFFKIMYLNLLNKKKLYF